MKGLVFTPHTANSVRLAEVAEPALQEGSILCEMQAVGVCGTDRDLLAGTYGWAPVGQQEMIIGHESLGTVIECPNNSGFKKGDWVVGIVRRPDPVPCPNCAVGEWDMCKNGQYTERGIKERNGFCSERFRIEPEFAVQVDKSLGVHGVLMEPTSVVAKAWEHIERVGSRGRFTPKIALITGAGPVGLLAALLGVQRGLQVHVLDKVTDGPKPQLVKNLGATYHSDFSELEKMTGKIDVAIECTGVGALVLELMKLGGAGSVICLAGISSGTRNIKIDMDSLNKNIVLENEAMFGSVNANRRHYEAAAQALKAAPRQWLEQIITHKVPLDRWPDAFAPSPNQIKKIIVK